MLVCLSSYVINLSNSLKENYQLNLSHLLSYKPVLMHPIRLALPDLRWYVPPKALKAIMVILRCLLLSRMFFLKLNIFFKLNIPSVILQVKLGNLLRIFASELPVSWERRSGLVEFISSPFTFNKLPKSNSLFQEGHFISVHTLPF